MSTVTIRLDEETDARLKRRLARTGETLSEFIREAVTRRLDEARLAFGPHACILRDFAGGQMTRLLPQPPVFKLPRLD